MSFGVSTVGYIEFNMNYGLYWENCVHMTSNDKSGIQLTKANKEKLQVDITPMAVTQKLLGIFSFCFQLHAQEK